VRLESDEENTVTQDAVRPDGDAAAAFFALLRGHPGQTLAIALVIAAFVLSFGYVGGFFSSTRLSPNRFVDALEANSGHFPGFRRAHSKGICFSGGFVASSAARSLSSATVFDGSLVPLIGRFALANGNPYSNDAKTPVRSMALSLRPAHGDEWRMANNGTPGLPFGTPEAFYQLVLAGTPDPRTGKPDPEKMRQYVAAHPEFTAFGERLKAHPFSSGFADDSYGGIDGFIFVAPDGTRRLVRWSMQSEDPFTSFSPAQAEGKSANYAFEDLIARVARGPVKWKLVATLAEPGDPNVATELWPEERRHVELGEVTVDHVESEAPGNCRDVNFDPLTLPSGIEPSDDPLPFARSAVYSTSFRRRAGESKTPSAVAGQSVSSPQ